MKDFTQSVFRFVDFRYFDQLIADMGSKQLVSRFKSVSSGLLGSVKRFVSEMSRLIAKCG